MLRILLVALALAGMHAGDDGLAWLDPRPPSGSWRGGGELRVDRAAAGADGGELGVDREALRLAWLAWRPAADQELWPEARAARTALRGDLLLPDGDPTGEYLDAAGGATWRRRQEDGHVLGLSAAATWSGRSDVAGGMHAGATAGASVRVPLTHPGDAMLLGVAYDSQPSPVAGLRVLPWGAWQARRGTWMFVLGIPFSFVAWRTPEAGASLAIAPLPGLEGDLRLAGPLRLLAGMRFASTALRTAPPAGDDRIFLSAWEWSGGLRLAGRPGLDADLIAGWAAGRRLGYGDRLLASRREGVALDPAPFAALRGRFSF